MDSKALRVTQLDSHILDAEIEDIIHSGIDALIAQLPPTIAPYVERFRIELQLFSDFLLWSHRLSKGCSPGQKLLDVRYERYSRRTVVMHFSMTVLISYFHDRLSRILLRYIPSKRMQQMNGLYRLILLAYHYVFLHFGGYGTLIERLLHLRAVHCSPPVLGTMNFDTMNRELMWHAFRDFLLFLLPIKATLQRLWIRWKLRQAVSKRKQRESESCTSRFARVLLPQGERHFPSTKESVSVQKRVLNATNGVLKCVRCEQNAIIPTRNIACGHICCYYCFSIEPWCASCGTIVER